MLTLKQIRDNKAFTLERLAVKGVDAAATVDRIEQLDDARKAIQAELDANLAQQNAIAKEIVSAHGGTIACESTPERTVFIITLPA